MAEKTFPVVIDGDTPTLFVNVSGSQVSIERMGAGLVVISLEEARKLHEVLEETIAYLSVSQIMRGPEGEK